MSIRSYTRSTDCHCESRSQNIICRINVSVVSSPAFWTSPLSNLQRQFIDDKTAISTTLARWEKAVNLNQFSTVPLAFILKLTNQFTPPSIRDATSKGTILNHVSHSQILNHYRLVFTYQLSGQLVQKIFSRVSNFCLNSSYSKSSFFSIFRTFLSSRKSLLCCSKLAVFLVKVLGISNFFGVRSSYQRSKTSIQANAFGGWWQWFNGWIVNQETDKPTSTRIKFNCYRRWVTFVFEGASPNYIQRFFALSKPQLTILPLESRTSKFSIASIPFLFKTRILSSVSPKVSKSNLKVSESLLKRYTTDFVKKLQLFSFLPLGQETRSLIVPDSFLSFVPSLCSNSQSFVINQPNTSHCPSQEIFLGPSWVKPIFIGTFGHLQQLTNYISHFITFNLKSVRQISRLPTSGASNPSQFAPFPLATKTSAVLSLRLDQPASFLVGVSRGGIR